MNPRHLLSCLMLAAPLLAAQQRFDTTRWRHKATIESAGDVQSARYAIFQLDAGAYSHASSSLGDLRVVSPSGFEAPYTIRETGLQGGGRIDLHPRVINRVVTPHGALQFVLDFAAAKGAAHNSLRFAWSESGFRRAVRIESGASQAEWDLVKEAMLLDFRQDGLIYQTLRIEYPESTQRYLRITILDWPDPATLTSVTSSREAAAQRVFTELASPSIRASAAQQGESRGDTAAEFAMPFRTPAPVRLDLTVEGGEFVRAVEVQQKYQSQLWSSVCHGTIARVAGDGNASLECHSALEGPVRVVIRNRDNAPVRVTAVRVSAPEKSLLFAAAEHGSYWLYAGNPGAHLPDYDLEQILARTAGVRPVTASIGLWQPNPGYQPPPLPFSERARAWLTPLLAVLALAIGAAAFLLIRKTRPAP